MSGFATTIRALAALAAVCVFPASIASAQDEAAAAKVLNTTRCGPMEASIIRTENAPSATNSVVFVNVPGAIGGFSVAPGTSRCIKLLFAAETVCQPSAAADFCYVARSSTACRCCRTARTSRPSTARTPPPPRTLTSGSGGSAGNYKIVLQRRVGNAMTVFTLDDWTFDLQLLQ
jgi:hypothetical protein